MVKEYCSFLTREDCTRQQGPMAICDKVRPSRPPLLCSVYTAVLYFTVLVLAALALHTTMQLPLPEYYTRTSSHVTSLVCFWRLAVQLHFRRIIAAHTDVQLGDCSFLDTCRHMKVWLTGLQVHPLFYSILYCTVLYCYCYCTVLLSVLYCTAPSWTRAAT